MKELALMGHKVTIITSDSNQLAIPPSMTTDYLFQDVDGMRLCWVRTMKYSVAKSVRRILSWLHFEWRVLWLPKNKFSAPDIVVISSLSLLTILNGFLWRARYKCRLIFEVRDIWPLTITEEGGFKSWNPFVLGLGFVEHLGYKHANAIVGTMPNLGEHVRSVLGYSRVTHCIPMGIDERNLASSENLPADYVEKNFPTDKFIVAYVGSIGISNALETFLECAESMKENLSIHFMIAGNGDLREIYRMRHAHLINLTFAPQVPKEMVQSVLSRCDLLYFSVHKSNVWQYGQSLNKVIDYMMSGKPIVASYEGYPSMINEANCGSYVAVGDVKALESEIRRYERMSKRERFEIGQRGPAWLKENRHYTKLAKDYLQIMLDVGMRA